MPGTRIGDLEFALVGLDDLTAHGQTQAQAHIARREEWLRHLLGHVRRKPAPRILHVNVDPLFAFPVGVGIRRTRAVNEHFVAVAEPVVVGTDVLVSGRLAAAGDSR